MALPSVASPQRTERQEGKERHSSQTFSYDKKQIITSPVSHILAHFRLLSDKTVE